MDDLISRQMAIEALTKANLQKHMDSVQDGGQENRSAIRIIMEMPSAQPERLTDGDFETIRIHLNACKEKLYNQQRWKEAEEYQRIIDRFMAFASAPAIRINYEK